MVNRSGFERGLKQLQDEVLIMGSMVNKALRQAMDALKRRDHFLAKHVIDSDKEINRHRFLIEEQALTLIATQQPVVAHDLRLVAAVIHISSELERMGDHAKGIARISELMQEQPSAKLLLQLPLMAEKCGQMLDAVLDIFLQQDGQAARELATRDDELDQLYDGIYRELLKTMTTDPQSVDNCTFLLWAAHNLERFGDRITNICERIIFVATGEMSEIAGSPQNGYAYGFSTSAMQELEG